MTTSSVSAPDATDLKNRWDALRAENPRLRIRNAADELGVTEVQLLAVGGHATRLRPEFQSILGDVPSLGRVMALTRNDHVVHERSGHYLNPELDGPHVGLFVGPDIDLRIFWRSWTHAYAVSQEMRGTMRHSLQFFANDGQAIHKIYLRPESDLDAYRALVDRYRHDDQDRVPAVDAVKPPQEEVPDTDIDVESFQEGWRTLKDTHDFFGLVHRHKLTRTQALRLAPEGDYAVKVDPAAVRAIVTRAAEAECPIMVFVGNKGMIQIHTGPVKRLLDHEEWFNVMDPDFNLHLREPAVTDCWVVRKPTEDGTVTAIECFDDTGTQIVQFFGKRKPGIPELELWRELVAGVQADFARTD